MASQARRREPLRFDIGGEIGGDRAGLAPRRANRRDDLLQGAEPAAVDDNGGASCTKRDRG